MKHVPVLLNDVMNALGDVRDKHIVDATFGAGGYTRAFLQAGAFVTAFDRDPDVITDVAQVKTEFGNRFEFVADTFSGIGNLKDKYDAIVFDLGISSMQIDIPARGFSFREDGPLDMRMSQTGVSAMDLIQRKSAQELAKILRDYGDVKKSGILANAIKQNLPQTTMELKKLIHNPKDIAPVFQALRIAVNDEMGQIETALSYVPDLLNVGGKCICVTFHSLEDRIVKNVFRDWTTVPGNPLLPVSQQAKFSLIKTIVPNAMEVQNNPRARSAHMRGVIKSY